MIATLMHNDLFLGGLCYALIAVPVLGIQYIHSSMPHHNYDETTQQEELL